MNNATCQEHEIGVSETIKKKQLEIGYFQKRKKSFNIALKLFLSKFQFFLRKIENLCDFKLHTEKK